MTVEMVRSTLNDAVVVPASALLKTPEGGTTVMIVARTATRTRWTVETGIREGDRVQITKGLAGGETVIVGGAYGLPTTPR